MKTNSFTILTAGLAGLLSMPAFAIEAPADDAPPPPSADAPQAAPEVDAVKPADKVAASFLGVVSAELPAVLAEHLGLKAGEGIVVQALMPDGPAAVAGVAVHDVITRVADQAVASPEDLTKQVAAHKPGEKVHLDVIHQGKPAGIDVTLGTRPDGMAALKPKPLAGLHLEGIPKELADRVRGAIEGNLGDVDINPDQDAADIAPQMRDAMREMKKRMEKAMEGLKVPDIAGGLKGDIAFEANVQQGATIRLMDEQGSIELRSNDGNKEVTIRDKDNKITWNGPWDTDQDKAAAPADVRQRVARLNLDSKFQGNGLRLQLGVRPPDAPGGE